MRIWLVEGVTLSRLVTAILFASLAFQPLPVALISGLYAFAMATDLVDGYLARRLKAQTYLGQVVDLVSDKSLTIVSLLYAAARGVSILPLALIGTREIIMLGVRMITVEGKQLLPTNRLLGGVMAAAMWGTTLFLILTPKNEHSTTVAARLYWIVATVLALNATHRIYASTRRISASLRKGS